MGIGSSFRFGEVLGYGFGEGWDYVDGGSSGCYISISKEYNNKVFKNMQDLATHGILETWYEIC